MTFSSSLVKQATSTWLYTGAATTNLAAMTPWTTVLLQDYHNQANISTLRFATSNGLEESGNASSSSVSILRRDASDYSDCLKAYLEDGTTRDSSYSDKCDYDPQYTTWFQAGKLSVNDSTFSDTYDNSWLAAVSKACVASDCSNGIAGVWASEWRISSISLGLAQLIDGFEGSLAVIDFNGIVLAASSGVTLSPALTCNDSYVRAGSKESVVNTKFFKQHWSGAIVRKLFIGIDVLSFLDHKYFPDVTAQYFGLMALERGQFYQEYEESRNIGIAAVAFGLIFVGLVVDKFTDKTKETLTHTCDRNKKIHQNLEDTKESKYIKALRERFETSVQALECHLELHPIPVCDLKFLDSFVYSSFMNNVRTTTKLELSQEEALQWIAVSFLQDLAQQRDMEVHLALLLCGPSYRCWLVPLFRVFSTRMYWYGASMMLAAVLWLELIETGVSETGASVPKTILLALVCIDAILCCLFYTLQCKPHIINGVHDKLVAVPGTLQPRLVATWFYLMLAFIALFAPAISFLPSNTVAYITPLLVLLRNEDIW